VDQDYVFEPVELVFDPPPPSEEGDDDDDDFGEPAGQGGDGGRVNVSACDCAIDGRHEPSSILLLIAPLVAFRRRRT
jgi:hypothetical protein